MKKYFNIILASALAALTVLSCAKQEQAYEPGTPDPSGCYGVFFPSQDAMGSHTYDPTMDKAVSITVTRTNTSGAITVPFTTTVSDEGIFNFGSITFADGQSETELDVTFPGAPDGKDLSFSVQLTDDNAYTSRYNSGAIALDFSVMCVEMKDFKTEDGSKKASITFSDADFWGEVHGDCYIEYYEVDGVRYCTTTGGVPVSPASAGKDGGPWGTGEQLVFKWYTNKKVTVNDISYDYIEVPAHYHGWASSDGIDVYYGDYFHMRTSMGLATSDYDNSYDYYANVAQADGYLPSYYDGHGGFVFNMGYWIFGTTRWYGYQNNAPVGIAEGYLRVDYDLTLETDYSSEGITPVYIEAGADVVSLKYAVYEGELNSAQMAARFEAIKAGTEPTESFDEFEFDEEEAKNYGAFGIAPETSGTYTVLAVACDKEGKIQNEASVVVNHICAADTEKNLVKVSVFTEDTPARYEELHSYDSFAYYICGKDLTAVHVGFFTEEDIKKNSIDLAVALVKSDASKYAVNKDVLKQINADGGYYTVQSNVPPKTTVYVVVWATNGALDGYAVDTYTTDPLPYVWNSLGKGKINDGFFTSMFGKSDFTVECDVFEEATTPGLYMVTGFQCALTAAFFGVDMETMAKYEGGNWRNAEVVIDASDPKAVFIEAQDYGVCVNAQAYGFIMIGTDKVGTLENGIMTWPKDKMYVGFPVEGKWYLGNGNGTFSITLPSAVSPTAVPTRVSARGGQVKDYVLSSGASVYNRPVVKYEREVKPVSVKTVKLENVRREKDATRGADKPLEQAR